MTGIAATVGGSLAIAAASTLGDFIWATWLPVHQVVYGLIHGMLLFVAVGLFLGIIGGRPAAGAVGGGMIGFAAAGVFYVLAPLMGFAAMFPAWVGLWIAMAALYGRLVGRRIEPGARYGGAERAAIATRGALAAVASGLGFYTISGIWRPFNPQGWDYVVHFGAWIVAYLPGFAALLVAKGRNTKA